MPVVSMFYGIVVLMYYFDNKKHHQPHVHVESGDDEAVISIPDGGILEGTLRSHLAVDGQAIFRIEPLK